MKRILSLFLALVLVLSIPMQAFAWDTGDQKYDKAVLLLYGGNWAEAISLFSENPMYKDSSKYLTCGKAMQLAAQGKYDLAIAIVSGIEDLKDGNAWVTYLQGQKAEAFELYDEAEALYLTIPAFRDVFDKLLALPRKKDATLNRDRCAFIADLRASESITDELWNRLLALMERRYSASEEQLFEELYADAETLLEDGLYAKAKFLFLQLARKNYRDADQMVTYIVARQSEAAEDYETACASYAEVLGVRDASLRMATVSDLLLSAEHEACMEAVSNTAYVDQNFALADRLRALANRTYSTSETLLFEELYADAEAMQAANKQDQAAVVYALLREHNYSDSALRLSEIVYLSVQENMTNGHYQYALKLLQSYVADEYPQKAEALNECQYQLALSEETAGKKADAYARFVALGDYKDSAQKAAYYENLFSSAISLRSNGKYDMALESFRALGDYSSASKQIPITYYEQGKSLLSNGKWEAAIQAFTNAGNYNNASTMVLETKYRQAAALATAGLYNDAYMLYSELGDYSDSQILMQKVRADKIYASGDMAQAYTIYATLGAPYQTHNSEYIAAYNAAVAMVYAGQYDEAIVAFEKLGQFNNAASVIPEVYYQKAEALAAQKQFVEAAQIFASIWDYWDSSEKYYEVGFDAYKAGCYCDAIQILAADVDYNNARETVYQAGLEASKAQQYDFSIVAFAAVGSYKDAAMRLTMDTYAYGNQLFEAEEYDRSAELFASLGDFSIAPSRAIEARYAAAVQVMGLGQYDDAAVRFSALGNHKDSRELFKECCHRSAQALYDAGSYGEALHVLVTNGLSGYKNSDTLISACRYELGKEAMHNGDYATARDRFNAAAPYSDSQAMAAQCQRLLTCGEAQALEEKGQYEAAYAQYKKCGETAKMQEMAYQTALEKVTSGEYEAAIAWFETAGDYSDAQEQILSIAEYYYVTQQYDLAEALYGKYLNTEIATQRIYELGQYYEEVGDNEHALKLYLQAGNYGDATEKAFECEYQIAEELFAVNDWQSAKNHYEKIADYKNAADMIVECDYQMAQALYAARNWSGAKAAFTQLADYKDAATLVTECDYQLAHSLYAAQDWNGAKAAFAQLADYKDAATLVTECDYQLAHSLYAAQDWNGAKAAFTQLAEYKDAATMVTECDYRMAQALYTAQNWNGAKAAFTQLAEYKDAASMAIECDYQHAQALYAAQDWEGAKALFLQITGHKDAKNMAIDCDYQRAEILYAAQDWEAAKALYTRISGHKDASSKIASCEQAIEYEKDPFSPGKYVTFGHYPQTTSGKDQTPIEWLILDRDGDKVLLLSRHGLDAKPYNTKEAFVSWEKCTLRKWLNSDFFNKAFSTGERKSILQTDVDNNKSQGYSKWSIDGGNNTKDKVFLLSYAEANKYLGVTYDNSNNTKSRVEPTSYAFNRGASASSSNKTADGKVAGSWSLRSPGYAQSLAACVDFDGSLDYCNVSDVTVSVRPALWVNLQAVTPLQ